MRGGVALAGAALFALLVLGSSTTFEEDLDAPADVAWSHPMGDPPNGTPPPRPRVPCIDDGPAAGAPLGGMGAGSVGRTYRGDFARWHLRVGAHVHRPAAHTFAAVRVDGRATVLSSLPAHARVDPVPPGDDRPGANPAPAPDPDPAPPRARRVLPADGSGGVYRALYPRAWYEYDPAALSPDADVRVAQVQFSPILPGRYRESSLPVGILRFVAQNDGDQTREVSIMLSFQNPLATVDVAPVDTRGPRETWRVPAGARFRHDDFLLRRGETRARGVHMHAQGVANGTLEPTKSWHGGFAIAVEDESSKSQSRDDLSSSRSPRTSATTSYDAANESDAWRIWDAFERTGELDDAATEGGRETTPTSAAAVCVTFRLAPGERTSTRFALAWDLPVAGFPGPGPGPAGGGEGTAFAKRYTKYHPHGADGEGTRTDGEPRIGAAAPELAAEALRRADEWEADIARWQRPYVRSARRASGDGDERPGATDGDGGGIGEGENASRNERDPGLDVSRPAWFVSALFNELHHLVDGGTIWGRPLTKAGTRALTDETRETRETRDSASASAGEDGEGGDANDVVGNGGAWGGSLGRFATLQNHDQALYAATPSYFYGSWGLAALWPGLDLALVADLAAAATASDDAERPIAWATARARGRETGTATETTTAPKRRKVRGAAAHDLGAPRAAPLTSSPNAHDLTDVNGWKDLAPQLMLLLARAHAFRGGFGGADDPGGVPLGVLSRLFEPAYYAMGNALRHHDADGDGAVEHERDPDTWGADHGFDRWPAAPGANTAYCGGLWLAALRVGAGMARDLNQTSARRSMERTLASAAVAHDKKLWAWSDPERDRDRDGDGDRARRGEDYPEAASAAGYYRFDSSGTAAGNASMATQVAGEWFLASIGAPGVLPAEKVRAALRAAYRLNVRGFARACASARASANAAKTDGDGDGTRAGTVPEESVSGTPPSMGAVNGATHPDGEVLDTYVHASEAWAGPTYALAAHMFLVGLDDEAWDTARGAYRATWEGGLGFRTPEAWDARGRFRHAMDGKAGAAWALEHALRVRAARRADAGSARTSALGSESRPAVPRDEL